MPIVSIVLPTYNGEDFLSDAMNSILRQTYTDWELIVVDDCSTDATPRILKDIASKDQRVHIYRNEKNQKLPNSLNIGFSMASGKLLTWTSDDNILEENALEIMVGALESNPSCDLVYTNIKIIDENGQIVRTNNHLTGPSLIYCYNVVGACFLYRSSLHNELEGYDPSLFLVEDYDFWLRAFRSHGVVHLQDAPYRYRVHGASLSGTREREIREKTCELLRRERRALSGNAKKSLLVNVGLLYNSLRLRMMRA